MLLPVLLVNRLQVGGPRTSALGSAHLSQGQAVCHLACPSEAPKPWPQLPLISESRSHSSEREFAPSIPGFLEKAEVSCLLALRLGRRGRSHLLFEVLAGEDAILRCIGWLLIAGLFVELLVSVSLIHLLGMFLASSSPASAWFTMCARCQAWLDCVDLV